MSKLPKKIEKRFDEYFPKLVNQDRLGKIIGSQIKSFIATILDEEKKKISKNIKKMYLPEIKETGGQPENDEIAQSINDILSSIINLIKEDK